MSWKLVGTVIGFMQPPYSFRCSVNRMLSSWIWIVRASILTSFSDFVFHCLSSTNYSYFMTMSCMKLSRSMFVPTSYFSWKRPMYLLNSELGDFFRTLRRFAIIEDSLSPQDDRSLRFSFKYLTNYLMLLSNFSKEIVWIMFCARRISCFTPRKIFVVNSFQARGPDRWWLSLFLARKSWADLSLELKSQV